MRFAIIACLTSLFVAGCVTPPDPVDLDPVVVEDQRASFLFDDATVRAMNVTTTSLNGEWDEFRAAVRQRQKANGDNTVWLYLANTVRTRTDGWPGPTSIYQSGGYGGLVCEYRVADIAEVCRTYRQDGFFIVGWLTPDDCSDINAASRETHLQHVRNCVEHVGPYVDGWCIGLEMDSDARKNHAAAMMTLGKQLDPGKKWGVHLNPRQWQSAVTWGADVLYYQSGFGRSLTWYVNDLTSIIAAVNGRCEVVAAEYHKSSDSAEARAIGKALAAVPGCAGTGTGRGE
jgi:hypothetical protein